MLFPTFRTNLFFRDRFIFLSLIFSLILNFLLFMGFYFRIEPRVEPINLHYTIYYGIDLIGPWWKVFLLPLSGIILFLINSTFAYLIYKKERILSYFLTSSALLIQGLLVIAGLLIILLNP